MIAKLTGYVDCLDTDSVIVDVSGVGYRVSISSTTAHHLTTKAPLTLFIETLVRQDAIQLVGFTSIEEQRWFRLLTAVQGVGTKVALALLSCHTPEALQQAIILQDKTEISRADGIGPKLAIRIVTELKGKVAGLAFPTLSQNPIRSHHHLDDALLALLQLGYRQSEALQAVHHSAQEAGEGADVSTLVRLSLPRLSALKIEL